MYFKQTHGMQPRNNLIIILKLPMYYEQAGKIKIK